MLDKSRTAAVGKITRTVVEHHPYALCFPCLAAEHRILEFDVREIAQILVLHDGFRVARCTC